VINSAQWVHGLGAGAATARNRDCETATMFSPVKTRGPKGQSRLGFTAILVGEVYVHQAVAFRELCSGVGQALRFFCRADHSKIESAFSRMQSSTC
jgi:hypothetical protein